MPYVKWVLKVGHELILVMYFFFFSSTSLQPFTLGNTEEDALNRYKHVTEMTILTIQLIVEFSKRVAGFDALLREDQITLLKVCARYFV